MRVRIGRRTRVRLAVVRAVVLHRLDDRRVGRLRREARDVEVLVGGAALHPQLADAADERRVTGRLGVAAEGVDAVELPFAVLLVVVVRPPDVGLEGLRVLRRRGADHLRRRHREDLVRALLHERGGHERDVGQAGGRAGRVLAVAHVVDRTQRAPPRCRPSATSFSHAWISALVVAFGVQLRVVEVDHDLAAGQPPPPALLFRYFGRALRPRRPNP